MTDIEPTDQSDTPGRTRRAVAFVRRTWAKAREAIWSTVEAHRLISAGLVFAAPGVSYWASAVEGPVSIGIVLVIQTGLAGATWYLGDARATVLEHERVEASTEMKVALTDALEPVAAKIARLATLPREGRRLERSGLLEVILAAASGLGDESSRPRACYFRLDPSATPRQMRPESFTGRANAATAVFEEGTEAGDAALGMIDEGAYLFCDDVSENPPPGWIASERGSYSTFIAVTVAAAGSPYGMLTLDACQVGALTEEDRQTLQVLGHLLGSIEALVK